MRATEIAGNAIITHRVHAAHPRADSCMWIRPLSQKLTMLAR